MYRIIQKVVKPFGILLVLLAVGQALAVSAAPPAQSPDPLGALRADSAEQPTVTYNNKTGVADFLSASVPTVGSNADERSRNFLKRYGALFGVTDAQGELAVMRSQTDEIGMSHMTYEQQYRGVPVFGARLVVHLDQAGRVTATGGQFQPGIQLADVTPTITGSEAQTLALRSIGADKIQWQQEPRLVIWTHNQGGAAARLTWEVRGFADEPLGTWHYFIDAHSGAVAYQLNELDNAKNRSVYDAGHGTSLPGSFVCNEGTCAGSGDTDVLDAFNFSGTTYDFYFNNFGRDGIDGAGLAMISTIHYSTAYDNAFWNGSQMVYGDGSGAGGFDLPLDRDLDIVAHELTHGVTQYTSALFYEDQSGALNESYSDVFGVMVNPGNFKIGETSWHDHTNGLRRMDDPTIGGQWSPNNPAGSVGQPDHMDVIGVLPSQFDNSGVHINSGIPNKAAYLIINGATFHNVTVTGIGFTKAAKIYYRTQTLYNTPFTQFIGAANNTLRACRDLIGQFGITSGNCDSVQNGFAAVGLGPSTTQNKKVFLPAVMNAVTNPGIYGRVTNSSAASSGTSVRLYQCNEGPSGCGQITSTTTDGGGNYRFTGVSSLPTGQVYLVIYIQTGATDCNRLTEWDSSTIYHYTAGDNAPGGDFDIHAVPLVSPGPNSNFSGSTLTFTWSQRTLPAGMLQDLPRVVIYNSGFSPIRGGPILARGTTSYGPFGPVGGFVNGNTYAWGIYAYGPDGLGFPRCVNVISRTSLAAAPNLNPGSGMAVLPYPDTHGQPLSTLPEYR